MSWIYLFAAGLFEIGWAVGLKYTHGLTRLGARGRVRTARPSRNRLTSIAPTVKTLGTRTGKPCATLRPNCPPLSNRPAAPE